MDAFAREIRSHVECPICMEIPVDNVMLMCVNGHNVCCSCKSKMGEDAVCPLGRCDYGVPPARNYAVANIIETFNSKRSCRYKTNGCTFDGNVASLATHESACKNNTGPATDKAAAAAKPFSPASPTKTTTNPSTTANPFTTTNPSTTANPSTTNNKCRVCPYTTANSSTTTNSSATKIKCRVCPYEAANKEAMRMHLNWIHPNFGPFSCMECDFRATYKVDLKRHFEAVHQKARKYQCAKCAFRTAHADNLKSHVKAIHMKIRIFPCEQCEYRAMSADSLEHHVELVHTKIRNFPCGECDYRASTADHLKHHTNAVHLKLRPFACAECAFKTGRLNNLKLHVNAVHQKVEEFQCELCDYAAASTFRLKLHVEGVHMKNGEFRCGRCDFKSKLSDVKIHVKAAHAERELFQCPECQFKTNYAQVLKRHINVRHQQVKVDGQQGKIKASEASALEAHGAAVIQQVTSFICSHCEFKAGRATDIEDHILADHPEIKADRGNRSIAATSKDANLVSDPNDANPDDARPNIVATLSCDLCEFRTCGGTLDLATHIMSAHSKKRKVESRNEASDSDDSLPNQAVACGSK